MQAREAQEKAIRSAKNRKEEDQKISGDGDKKIGKCRKCGSKLNEDGDCPKC